MTEWLEIIKDLGIGGGVLVGMIVAVRALKNGKPCPAEPVLQEFHDTLTESKTVQRGLTEAVKRNTAAAERQTDTLVQILTEGKK